MPTWAAIVIGILGGIGGLGGVFAFAQFLINRKDEKNKELEEIKNDLKDIKEELQEAKTARTRLQLLNLMQHEGSQHEMMMVAEVYFKELNGDWYMSPIFQRYLDEHGIEKPVWFKGDKE